MFVRADLSEAGHSAFQYLPFSMGLVSFGGEPASVPEGLVHAIRRRLEQIVEDGGEFFGGLKRGDRVWIQDGPFAGYEAVFDARISGRERVRVLLQVLSGRSLPVELSPSQLESQQRI
jgi:transcriptional antiterminator RfaH